MSKTVVSFKIDSKLKSILQKLAEEETRTLSNYLVTVIQNHLKAKGIDWQEREEQEEGREPSAISFSSRNLDRAADEDR